LKGTRGTNFTNECDLYPESSNAFGIFQVKWCIMDWRENRNLHERERLYEK